jgi:CBS domain-containing protein
MDNVKKLMSGGVRTISPDQTIRDAAVAMADADVGSLPVGENDRLIGMITDRDIVLRAVAAGRGADTPVREVMTDNIKYCFDDEPINEVAKNMGNLGVRRLPVINRDKRLVGIISLSNIASADDGSAKSRFFEKVASPH